MPGTILAPPGDSLNHAEVRGKVLSLRFDEPDLHDAGRRCVIRTYILLPPRRVEMLS